MRVCHQIGLIGMMGVGGGGHWLSSVSGVASSWLNGVGGVYDS